MQHKSDLIRIKRKTIIYFIAIVIALVSVTPVLADYLGPNRTVTETTSVCKVILYECKYVPLKDEWRYKSVDDWSCSNESKPWQAYPSQPAGCSAGSGDQYWDRDEAQQETTNTYAPATISGLLQNCTLQNGWCVSAAKFSLSGNEPVPGYSILAIEGFRNSQNFACAGESCTVSLNEGDNSFTYWALSTWGDSSDMGTFNAKVDSQMPSVTGAFTGILGTNNWYVSPVSFNGSASDATSGLASFTCTLDGLSLPYCNTITLNSEGLHSLVLTARDNAENIRTISRSASIDTQNPALNSNLSGTLGSNTWYTSAILNAAALDPIPGSGLSSIDYNLDNSKWISFPASGVLELPEGKHSIDIRALDKAGHTVSASKSFWLDSVAPNVTFNSLGTLGLNNWHISNINITASANDATSGLDILEFSLDNSAWTSYTAPLTLTEGTHDLSFWAQDSAGLATQVDGTYHVDTRAPQISGSLSGVYGTNGWYVSEVTLSASASDPVPGSDLDDFTYILNSAPETPYTNSLSLTDGLHAIQLNAQDRAGLKYSTEQIIKVDTVRPSLNIETTLPTWLKETFTLNGSASDAGSGLSKVEISTDGKQTWQAVIGTASWSYNWNTLDSLNGINDVYVRVTDRAGLTTEKTFSVGVDNIVPKISVPDSWYQWDSIVLDVWDNHSGLSEVRVEIIDPEGRWPTRKIDLDSESFPVDLKWDRRFKDGTVAPLGIYDVKVIAFDNLGNQARQSASINILLGILPAGPTATSQPHSRFETIQTPNPTALPAPYHITTQTPIVSTFGSTPEPFTQAAQRSEAIPTPRLAPTQTTVLDWLQSIFSPNYDSATILSEVVLPEESEETSQKSGLDGSVLWGSSAAAMIGAATAYALEERRKQREEKAQQEALEAQKEERRRKIRRRKMEKLEVKWAQELALEEERRRQQTQIQNIHMETKMMLMEAQEDVLWMASQATIRNREDARKAEDLQAGLEVYFAGTRQGEKEAASTKPNWWEKTKSFFQEKIVQPYIQPIVERTKQFVINESAWINEEIYKPYMQPTVERTKQFVINESAWINENIYQPHIKPVVNRTTQFVINESLWLNENIYKPHVKPIVDRTKQFVINESTWLNEEVYQPYVKPVVTTINEKIYQPYIQPSVNVISEKVYQPYFKPVVDDVYAWSEKTWDKWGEWVHGVLDAAGLIPGFGEIADGINCLIYLGEGRYLEATLSALAMIPVIGDLGKAGKLSLEIGKEALEEAAEKAAKDIGKEVLEREWMHVALEAASGIPGTGKVTDGINSLIYLNQGRYLEAGISAVSMVPILGDLTKIGLNIGKQILGKAAERAAKEASQELIKKTLKEASEKVASKVAAVPARSIEKVSKVVAEETVEETLRQGNEEAAQLILKEVVEGQVSKLPAGIAERLTDESAHDLAERISKELGGKKVWVSAKSGSIYVSSPPAEGFILAEQLAKTDLTKTDEVEKILKRIAELTSRGSGNNVVLGPFGLKGAFIQEALDTNGIFWDVGDELWEALEKTGLDMFRVNDQFLRLQITKGIDRFDVILMDVDGVIDDLNVGPQKDWVDLKYTEKEILDLASMPNIPYQLVENSWIRSDLISSME